MAFDQSTRNRLARFVGETRFLLSEEFTRQLQNEYGMDPESGAVTELEKLTALDDSRRETARILRETLEYYLAGKADDKKNRQETLQRIVREQAFTVLNRLCALRMAESRGILIESIAQGYQSKGFLLYARLAGAGLGETGDAYRTYLFSLFDEFAVDLAALFDRFNPQGRLFPRETALLKVTALINDPEIDPLWAEDETIGWIYQYFNSIEERQEMRKSRSPRNSRELAVRNQFFTPRYVVEFLTDNTLGRIWYEMTKGATALKDACQYLVRRPNEIFLNEGAEAPAQASDENLSQEELLRQPAYIPHHPLKDPREIKMLDPACGSMHFGLYAFDLFEQIYAEAWDLEESLGEDAPWRLADLDSLHKTYPNRAAFLRDVPRLIIERNIHGVDIDPRAVQIAGLSLWLRAQKSWQAQGVRPQDRPQIRRSNIVCAEPMPGDRAMLEEFLGTLKEDRLEALMRQAMHVPAGQKVRATKAMAASLGKLVRVIWQEMELAGEAGSLLKIEETLREAIAEARKESEEKSPLFQAIEFGANAGEEKLGFWDQAETLTLTALQNYAEQAAEGQSYRRRLFAGDATHGFAFIDLCRKNYDIALMNPPFGDCSKDSKKYIEKNYERSKGDILSNFIERALNLSTTNGKVGTITNRTCFFLTTQSSLREKVFEHDGYVELMTDLGHGVLDAMVETAAYTLSRTKQIGDTAHFFRCLMHNNKNEILLETIREFISGQSNNAFSINPLEFSRIKGSPYCYWVSSHTINRISQFPSLEGTLGTIRVGLQTGDDWRFLRLSWEIPANELVLQPMSSNLEQIQDECKKQLNETGRWVFFSKTESALPWFSPITLVVEWKEDGNQLKNFTDKNGKLRSRPQNLNYYFLPGFSYMLRSTRLVPYIVPPGVIPTAGRAQFFPLSGYEYGAIGYCASIIASAIARFSGENFGQPKFQAGMVQNIPVPNLSNSLVEKLKTLIENEFFSRRSIAQKYEPYQEFSLPSLLTKSSLSSPDWSRYSLLGFDFENEIAEEMGLTADQLEELSRDIRESLQMQYEDKSKLISDNTIEEDEADDSDLATVAYIDDSVVAQCEQLLSYCVGVVFGRWDVRFALNPNLLPKLSSAFEPLPVCPPSSLLSPIGLPAISGKISSEAWLNLRKQMNSIPSVINNKVKVDNDEFSSATIKDSEYPLQVMWHGILVNDPSNKNDITTRVKETLALVSSGQSDDLEQFIIQNIGHVDLMDYFANFNNGFWADHLNRYSMNRRQAPIYWQLSTPSNSYSLWLYYHRLNDQTLFTCVNDFVDPKIQQVSEEAKSLRVKKSRSSAEERELERLTDFERELKDFRDELLRVAKFWKPNLNDGVQITAAPLWKVFQHRPWQKKLKETWESLEAGEYDWSHLAYSIWTDRVREKCKTDKSLAIAHDLEHVYVEPQVPLKKKAGRKKKIETDEMFDEDN